jgi:hypothetical protein
MTDLRRFFVAISIIAGAGACAPDRLSVEVAEALIGAAPCSHRVTSVMSEWGTAATYLEAPPSYTGLRVYRFPTERLGEWVVLTLPVAGPPSLTRVDPSGATGVSFDADCAVQRSFVGHESPPGEREELFTDDDLRDALNSESGGVVIYAWSPHMPLSVDGYPEVAAAAHSRGMTALPVLIAFSEADFARREAERVGIPQAGLRQMDSVELIQRGAQLHAPSIIVFSPEGISALLPGYRNAEGYGRFLDAFFDEVGRG